MVDEQQAKKNVREYLREGLLRKQAYDELVFSTYVHNYKESLQAAEKMRAEGNVLWTIVPSYYSMFYAANAALCKEGYRTGHKIVHKVTFDATAALLAGKLAKALMDDYEDVQAAALGLIENYEQEMHKRSKIQYETTYKAKQAQAETSFQRAKKFCFEMEKLL